MFKLLIIDDYPIFRRGIISILENYPEFQVVGEAPNGREALAMAAKLKPDIVLMGFRMPGGDGVKATKALKRLLPKIKILILAVTERSESIFPIIEAGAMGYVLKSASLDQLVAAINLVAAGDVIVFSSISDGVLDQIKGGLKTIATSRVSKLSPRETEVLKLVAQGNKNRVIAQKLHVSESTIKAHLRSILGILQVTNRAQAVAEAVAKGLLD